VAWRVSGAQSSNFASLAQADFLADSFLPLVKVQTQGHICPCRRTPNRACASPVFTVATLVETLPRIAKENLASHLGATPKQVARELRAFARSARVLSSDEPRLIDEHPMEWVGVYDGKVCASAKSFRALMSKLKKKGIPPSKAIIHFVDTSGRRLIL
jgi:hypothetical protein